MSNQHDFTIRVSVGIFPDEEVKTHPAKITGIRPLIDLQGFIGTDTDLEDENDGVELYRVNNTWYVVVGTIVLTGYGFHGKNVFDAVLNGGEVCYRV